MFKNSTRKGLAIGAAFALAFSGLAAAPAQAAGEVVLEPTAGTSYATFVTEDFDLTASLAAGQPIANIAQLKYKIEKAAGTAVSYSATATASAVSAIGAADAVASASTSFVLTPAATSTTVPNKISVAIVGANSASATVDVTVTAFIDSNSNGSVDSGEFATAKTVSFKKYADVSSVVALTQPSEGDTTVKATATFTGLNADQLSAADTKVVFSVGGTASASGVVAADGVFSDTFAALTTSATVSAQATYKTFNVGSADTKTVTNRTIAAVTSSVVAGDNAKGALVRVNTEFQFKAVVKDATTTTASGVAGAAVTAKIQTSRTLSSTISITVAGTTYTDSAKLPTALAVGTSDANGAVTFAIKTAGFSDQDTITVTVASQNITATAVALTAETADYTVTNDASDYAVVGLGASYTLNYSVKDQWGVLTTNADRLKLTAGSADAVYANLSGGKASVTFTAPTTSQTVSVVNNELQKQDSATLNWETRTSVTASAVSVLVTSTASTFDTNPATTGSASISRVNTDGDLTNVVSFSGSVNNPGAVVTIASAGLKFAKTADGDVSADSIAITTGASGNFEVYVFSHVAGTATISYTVGAVTKTTTLTTAAAAYNEGKVVTITTNDANGYVAPGSTVRATVKVTDEYGNPVQNPGTTASLKVTVAGPGFVSSLPTSTDANGETAVFSVLLGSADAGDLVITATYDADGATTTIAAVSATKTLVVGAAPAADQKLTVGTFKGYVAIYAKGYTGSKLSAKVAGKWLSVASLSSFQRVVRNTGAGYTIKVDLYIDGKFVKSETVVTK